MIDSDAFDQLIRRLKGKIDEESWDSLDHFYRHGEYGLAIETLCDDLYEVDQSIPEPELELVKDIGNSMGLTRRSFILLTKQDS